MTPGGQDPRELADRVVENGSRSEDMVEALPAAGPDRTLFLRRLASRAVLRERDESGEVEQPGDSSALVASARVVYEAEKERTTAQGAASDLSRLPTWIAAKAAFGNDVTFVVKLAGRLVTAPSPRFLRYAADALGVAVAQVREHFADGLPRGLVGAENKAAGKPRADAVEDFEAAVRASKVSEALRTRWLAG